MSYIKATNILPKELLELIQEYIDGECIYIPRKSDNKMDWGSKTSFKEETIIRNNEIYNAYLCGCSLKYLSENYYLSLKSIQRIILQEKRRKI